MDNNNDRFNFYVSGIVFFVVGFIFALSVYSVKAQVVDKSVQLSSFDLKVQSLMATSTLDVITATKIVVDKDNTDKIVARLDRIVYFLKLIYEKSN